MRYGASIFLGLVEAELASYEDCRRFLITCPVCREAVFKGVLPRRDGHETHYFSHYREVPSEQAERCELRVSSITKAQAEEARAEARGQALAIFRARFRECVLWSRAHVIFGLPPNPAIERGVAHMLSRPLWRDFARKSQKYVRAEWASEATPEILDIMDRETPELFREETRRHARAMLGHALAPGSAQAWVFLATFSARWGLLNDEELPPAVVRAFLDGRDSDVARAIRWTVGHPDAFRSMMEDIATTVVWVVHAIPYLDILRETIGSAERPPRRSG